MALKRSERGSVFKNNKIIVTPDGKTQVFLIQNIPVLHSGLHAQSHAQLA